MTGKLQENTLSLKTFVKIESFNVGRFIFLNLFKCDQLKNFTFIEKHKRGMTIEISVRKDVIKCLFRIMDLKCVRTQGRLRERGFNKVI